MVVGGLWLGAATARAERSWLPSSAAVTTTPAADALVTDFVVFGDARTNLDVATRVVEAIVEEAPDFVIATGDYVNDGGNVEEWVAFRKLIQPLMRSAPLYAAIGNHDRQGRGRRVEHFRDTFKPQKGPHGERYYYVDRGALRLIVLDSNTYANADQTEWLTNTLNAGAKLGRQMFVVMHHPVYSIALHGGHAAIREHWAPLFEHYGVQAVFSGHDHVYARAEAGGVRYFVTGGAGAPLYGKSRNPGDLDVAAVKHHARVHHYLRVHVVPQMIEVTAVKLDGSIIESVRWGLVQPSGGAVPARTTMSLLRDLAVGEGGAPMLAVGGASPDSVGSAAIAPSSQPAGALPLAARQAAPSPLWLLIGLAAVLVGAIRLGR